ncbi:hypothetical protein QUB63_17040 [Microcoleus sp. ARI1-B5]|uniref:hypothetical protein n=1 Tax=unclassified Microcoleus TaxID=2642155 RepID=UPI002FD1A08C
MKNWFHIQEGQATVNLDCVSFISWNERKKCRDGVTRAITVVTIGTAGTYDPDTRSIEYHEIWIRDDGDRKALYDTVFASNMATAANIPIELYLNN